MNNLITPLPITSLSVTGNIGCGKSTVLKMLAEKGFKIVDSDALVVALYQKSHASYSLLAKDLDNWLGTQFYEQTVIDKNILREKLSNIDNGLNIISNMLSPYLMQEMYSLFLQYKNTIVFEVPVLFETKLNHFFSRILLVTCEDDIRFERIKLRNPQLSEDKIRWFMNNQIPQKDKISKVNWTINNSGSKDILNEQFNHFYHDFLASQ